MARLRSELSVLRYVLRIAWIRLLHTRTTAFELVNLLLAVLGAWTIVETVTDLPVLRVAKHSWWIPTTLVVLLVSLLTLWAGRRPQDIFRLAAASEERTERLRGWLAEGMRSDTAYSLLADLYDPLVRTVESRLGGNTVEWPLDSSGSRILAFTVRPRKEQDLESLVDPVLAVRSQEWRRSVSTFAPERQMYMSTLRRAAHARVPFDDEEGDNVVLDQLYASDTLRLRIATATYGQIVRTSDSLINEFALLGYVIERSAIRGRRSPLRPDPGRVLALLPWRRAVHRWNTGTALFLSPDQRAAGLGVAVTILHVWNGSLVAYVAKRSSAVGTYPDAMHVFPAGMMNTRIDTALSPEESLTELPRMNMLAEFLEECFDVEELSGRNIGSVSVTVRDELEKRGLGWIRPRFTGLTIDLLNLRAEICGVLDLSDRPSGLTDFQMSWEFTKSASIQPVGLSLGASCGRREDFVQSGLGALHLARRHVEAHQV